MTPEERAKNIYGYVNDAGFEPEDEWMSEATRDFIAAQLRAAVGEVEADRDRWTESAVTLEKALEGVRDKALEEAAKISDENCNAYDCEPFNESKDSTSHKIRALKSK